MELPKHPFLRIQKQTFPKTHTQKCPTRGRGGPSAGRSGTPVTCPPRAFLPVSTLLKSPSMHEVRFLLCKRQSPSQHQAANTPSCAVLCVSRRVPRHPDPAHEGTKPIPGAGVLKQVPASWQERGTEGGTIQRLQDETKPSVTGHWNHFFRVSTLAERFPQT